MCSEILILALLRRGPRHGYEIKKEVEWVASFLEKLQATS